MLLKRFLNEALALVLLLGTGSLAVCPSVCSCSHSHREVDCSWRALRQLPEDLQHNLRSLNLSHNRFHNLDGKLTAYTHLRILDLSYNRLSKLPQDLPRSLWQLHATSNRIQLLDKNDTVYQWNLRVLDLSCNKLERAIFINNTLISLSKLNLSNNHLPTLPTNLPAHLETIDLSHNLLARVLEGSLDRLTRLSHFYLHANRFSTLPSGVLDKLTSLRVITLDNNPWACHFYADITYLVSWTQRTPAHVLGCPCNTHPVCGGVRRSRTGGWHFASYNLPPLAANAQDLSSISPVSMTGWWYLPSSSLPTTPHTTKESQEHPFTARPISISTQRQRTHLTINHLSTTAIPTDVDHLWHTDSHLIPATKETSPSDTSSFSDTGLITETSKRGDVALATDRFFTTEGPSIQTKKTTTLRTRSVRRNNQNLPSSRSSPSLAACFSLPLFHNILSLILPQIL